MHIETGSVRGTCAAHALHRRSSRAGHTQVTRRSRAAHALRFVVKAGAGRGAPSGCLPQATGQKLATHPMGPSRRLGRGRTRACEASAVGQGAVPCDARTVRGRVAHGLASLAGWVASTGVERVRLAM